MLLAFHNDPQIQAHVIEQVDAHAMADEVTQGIYWERGRGCAVGCTVHSSNHADYETLLGIPRAIARLQDGIFEGIPLAEAKKFPSQFLRAIPLGADLSQVVDQFLVWLLVDPSDGIVQFSENDEQRRTIHQVAELLQRRINGEMISGHELNAAVAAYDPADCDPADAAAYAAYANTDTAAADAAAYAAAAAAYDAYAAADAAAVAAAAAAYDAYDAYDAADAAAVAAAYDAYTAARIKQRDKLLSLLSSAHVPSPEKTIRASVREDAITCGLCSCIADCQGKHTRR